MAGVWRRADRLASRYPILSALTSAGVKGAVGDLIAQTVIEKRDKINYHRTAVYTTYSGLYLGGVQYFVQCRVLETLFPGRTPISIIKKVFLDQFVHLPLVAFPCLYIIKEAFMPSHKCPESRLMDRVITSYSRDAIEVNIALWKFWIPATTIGFAFVPTHWRIPYNSALSLGWTIILSSLQARLDSKALETDPTSGVDKLEAAIVS